MTIGWYVHHHGTGHLRRFQAVARHLDCVTGLSSLPRPPDVSPEQWVSLPLDAPAPDGSDPAPGGALHWVPRRHPGLRSRMAAIAAWIETARPRLIVCDVSVEVAVFARLMGIPVAWIAQRGIRVDPPHRLAYGVSTVLAPWTEQLTGSATGIPPDTRFVGALSRYDDLAAVAAPGRSHALVLLGGGGHDVTAARLAASARATPQWSWSVAGLDEPARGAVIDHGRVPDTWALLGDADVVIASAGSNLVAEVAAARRPLVCLPQERPFGEQHDQAATLARAGLAESLPDWPDPAQWSAVLARAGDRDPATWSRLHDGRGAQRLAEAISELACASA